MKPILVSECPEIWVVNARAYGLTHKLIVAIRAKNGSMRYQVGFVVGSGDVESSYQHYPRHGVIPPSIMDLMRQAAVNHAQGRNQ